jgi:MFS transporter, DHA1 family, inner membrane transport protein
MFGVCSMALYVAGMSLAPTYLVLLLVSLVGAIGRPALTSVPLAHAGTHFHGAARQRVVSWTSAGMSGAGIIGIPILTAIAATYDWRAAFAVLAAVSLVIGAIMWLALPSESVDTTSRPTGNPLGRRRLWAACSPLLRHRPTMGIILATSLGAVMMFTVLTYIGALVTRRYGYSVQEVGWVFFAISVAFLGGSLLAGGRVGRLPIRTVLITTRGLSGILVGVAFALSLPAFVVIGLTMLGVLANGISNVCTILLLTGETPGGRATTMTLNALTVNLGGALGSSLGGLLLTTGGFPALGFSATPFGLAGVALVWWSRP